MKLSSLRVAVFDREKLSGEMQDEPKMGTYFKFDSSSSTYLTVKLNQIQLICFSSYLWTRDSVLVQLYSSLCQVLKGNQR